MAVKDTKPPKWSKDSGDTSDIYRDEKPSPFSIEAIRSGAVSSNLAKGFIIVSGLILAGGFLIGGFGTPSEPGYVNPTTTVATVQNEEVTAGTLASALERTQQFNELYGQRTSASSYLRDKQSALKQLTDSAALIVAAQNAGITVSGADIDKKIEELIAEQLKPQGGQTPAAFRRAIETQFGSMEKAKTELRTNLNQNRDAISKDLLVEKLEKKIKDENKVTEDDFKRSVTKLKLWQISIRPDSPKPGTKDVTKEIEKLNLKGQEEANKLLASLKKTPTLAAFQAAARKQSDDAATKAKGGDLGLKLPSEVPYGPEFGETLAKSASNLVGPLKDAGGTQWIFFIENRKTELPKDWAKNKKKLLADFETQRDNEAWQKARTEFTKGVTPQVSDPALAAYELINDPEFFNKSTEEQKKIREEALERFAGAVQNATGTEAAAIHLQMANLYRDLNKKPEQLKALEQAVKAEPNDAELRLEYARSLRDAAQPKVALAQLQEASKALDNAPAPAMMFGGGGDPNAGMRQQIAAEFTQLKQPKLAEAERAKIKAPEPGAGGGFPGGIQMMPPQ